MTENKTKTISMDERDLITRHEQMLKECLPQHSTFETHLMTEAGWKLRVEYVKEIDGGFESIPDPYITQEQMLEVHSCIRTVTRLFGLPQIGDFIDAGGDLQKVVERTFDENKKIITITVR